MSTPPGPEPKWKPGSKKYEDQQKEKEAEIKRQEQARKNVESAIQKGLIKDPSKAQTKVDGKTYTFDITKDKSASQPKPSFQQQFAREFFIKQGKQVEYTQTGGVKVTDPGSGRVTHVDRALRVTEVPASATVRSEFAGEVQTQRRRVDERKPQPQEPDQIIEPKPPPQKQPGRVEESRPSRLKQIKENIYRWADIKAKQYYGVDISGAQKEAKYALTREGFKASVIQSTYKWGKKQISGAEKSIAFNLEMRPLIFEGRYNELSEKSREFQKQPDVKSVKKTVEFSGLIIGAGGAATKFPKLIPYLSKAGTAITGYEWLKFSKEPSSKQFYKSVAFSAPGVVASAGKVRSAAVKIGSEEVTAASVGTDTFPTSKSPSEALDKFAKAAGRVVHSTAMKIKSKFKVSGTDPELIAFYTSPKGQASFHFLRLSEPEAEAAYSLFPQIKRPTVVEVQIKGVKRVPQEVLMKDVGTPKGQRLKHSQEYIDKKAGGGYAYLGPRFELGRTAETEAVLAKDTQLSLKRPEGTVPWLKGSKKHFKLHGENVPIKEYVIELGATKGARTSKGVDMGVTLQRSSSSLSSSFSKYRRSAYEDLILVRRSTSSSPRSRRISRGSSAAVSLTDKSTPSLSQTSRQRERPPTSTPRITFLRYPPPQLRPPTTYTPTQPRDPRQTTPPRITQTTSTYFPRSTSFIRSPPTTTPKKPNLGLDPFKKTTPKQLKKDVFKSTKRYVPTIHAAFTGVKGKIPKGYKQGLTGIEQRPVVI